MSEAQIPDPTLERLPLYYRRCLEALGRHEPVVSSDDLAVAADTQAAIVRKDLGHLAERGRPGVGYEADRLAARLREVLGVDHPRPAALVGAGSLGRGLARYPGFEAYGLKIVLLFDNDPDKIGRKFGKLEVEPTENLIASIRKRKVQIGIVATPAEVAQHVAQMLARAGVRAIWNFAPRRLTDLPGVVVKNEDLARELAVLCHRLSWTQG